MLERPPERLDASPRTYIRPAEGTRQVPARLPDSIASAHLEAFAGAFRVNHGVGYRNDRQRGDYRRVDHQPAGVEDHHRHPVCGANCGRVDHFRQDHDLQRVHQDGDDRGCGDHLGEDRCARHGQDYHWCAQCRAYRGVVDYGGQARNQRHPGGACGWTGTIRIGPTQIAWYNGSTLEGAIPSSGMRFYYGSHYIGWTGQQSKAGAADIRGISNSLEYTGDYISWSYKTTSTSTTYTTMLALDPRGKFYGRSGVHLGASLRTHGHDFYTQGNRIIIPQDCTLKGVGTYPGWAGSSGRAKVVFHTNDLYVISGNTFYNMTSVFKRVKDLMSRMNSLISLLNQGWVKTSTVAQTATSPGTTSATPGCRPCRPH